jgi:hypothetical protein
MRTILLGGTGFAFIAIAAFSFTPLGSSLASVITTRDSLTAACLEAITTSLNDDAHHTYTIDKKDLNDDDADDRIVTFTDGASCGTNGCIHEICLTQGSAVTRIPFGYAANRLTVDNSKTNNMYDITLNERITLGWDGERYVPTE